MALLSVWRLGVRVLWQQSDTVIEKCSVLRNGQGRGEGNTNNNEPKLTIAVCFYIFVAGGGREWRCKVSGGRGVKVLRWQSDIVIEK